MFLRVMLKLSKAMNVVAGFSLSFMVLITVADVILRSFRRPVPGTYELVALSGVAVAAFAFPLTSWTKGHIFVDFLVMKLSPGGRRIVNTFTRLLGICFFLPSAIYLYRFALKLRASGEVTLTLQMPFYPVVWAAAFCCFVECLILITDMVKIWEETYE